METGSEQPLATTSALDEALRYLTYTFASASGFMVWHLIKFYTADSIKEKLDSTSMESTILALLFAFGSWALIYMVSGIFLATKRRRGWPVFIYIGLAGAILTGSLVLFNYRPPQ